jgi:hypothetical protein
MRKGLRSIVALVALVAIAAVTMGAVTTTPALDQAQGASSDGDSLGAAPDTSSSFTIHREVSAWQIVVWCDSVAIYKTQVSPDNGTTWLTIDVDTTAVATLESTADFGVSYNGWDARVIWDGLWSTGKKRGNAYRNTTR